MAAPQQQQAGGQSDNSLSALWIIVGVFIAGYFLWIALRKYIVTFILKLKLFELTLIDWATPASYGAKYIVPAKEQIYLMASNPENVQFQHLIDLSTYVGDFMKIPIAMVLIGLAYLAYNSDLTLSFKKKYDMQSLTNEEKVNWPQINPVVKLNLAKEHVEEGAWAMAMTPMKFAKLHNLIEVLPDLPGKLPGQNIRIKKGMANQIFALQLGKLWSGWEALPDYAIALFAVFGARLNHDRKPAEALIKQIAISSGGDKLNFDGAHKMAAKYANTKPVQAIMARHAYECTVLATMLRLARADGVLPSADFLWLKPRDRLFWFVLNGVGRQTPTVEVAGVYAHWFAELELKRKLYVPMVDEATIALQVAVSEMIYHPDEEDESH